MEADRWLSESVCGLCLMEFNTQQFTYINLLFSVPELIDEHFTGRPNKVLVKYKKRTYVGTCIPAVSLGCLKVPCYVVKLILPVSFNNTVSLACQ